MGRTIVITGGAGFIGSHIADCFLNQGFRVVIIDNLSTGCKENIPKKATFYHADLLNFTEIKNILEKEHPNIISHHAAQAQVRFSVIHPQLDAQINLIGLINLLESVKDFSNLQFVFASSGGAIYDGSEHLPSSEKMPINPVSPYGVSKLSAEFYINMYGQMYPQLQTTIFRYANVYGPRQSPSGEAGVIAIFIKNLLKQEIPIIFGDGNSIRDYVYIEDVVQANLLAITKKITGTFNIGSSQETSTLAIFQKISKEMKFLDPPKFSKAIAGEQLYSCLDYQKAAKYLRWQPMVHLDKGIQNTIALQKTLL